MSTSVIHSTVCNSSPELVYDIISNSAQWPRLFEPCLAVRKLASDEASEHIEITAMVNDEAMIWESHRTFRPDILGIDSRLLRPMKLVDTMDVVWRVFAVGDTQALLVLEHRYAITEDVAGAVEGVRTREEAVAFIKQAINVNSGKELRNIKVAAEGGDVRPIHPGPRSVCHSIVCDAPASAVYDVIADVGRWPQLFESCVSVAVLEARGDSELVRIEALQEGVPVAWETMRTYVDSTFTIDFWLVIPMPLLESMSGQWRVIPLDLKRSVLTVTRTFELCAAIDGIRDGIATPRQALAFIQRFIAETSESELRAIKSFVEVEDERRLRLRTTYSLPFPPHEVYGVLANVRRWPELLPHCDSLELIYDDGQNQEFMMGVAGPGGGDRFRSIRRCNAEAFTISYFQPSPPPILDAHSGSWSVRAGVGGNAKVIVEHDIRVNPERCADRFGEGDLGKNRSRVREMVLQNGAATIHACREWLSRKMGPRNG